MVKACVVKIDLNTTCKDSQNPEEGIKLVVGIGKTKRTLKHEGFHLSSHYFSSENSDNDYALMTDEGATVFLQQYLDCSFDIDQTLALLKEEMRVVEISDEYRQAAVLTGELVKQIGFDTFAKIYSVNTPRDWLDVIEDSLGKEKEMEYYSKMKELFRGSTPKMG